MASIVVMRDRLARTTMMSAPGAIPGKTAPPPAAMPATCVP